MSNEHYVPQHFLRGWANDPERKKIFAHTLIPKAGNKVVFREKSIISSSSDDDLYRIIDGENHAEFETVVMTHAVDTPGSVIISKVRDCGLGSLTGLERAQLAAYIVILEARHPINIQAMTLTKEDISSVFDKISKQYPFKSEAIIDVRDFMQKIQASSGAAALGMFAGWGHGPEAQALLSRWWIEIERSDVQGFIGSNYPVGRYNDYRGDNFVLTIPLSPTKAIWCMPPVFKAMYDNVSDGEKEGTRRQICKYIDICTLGFATEAYSQLSEKDPFIEQHLGWALRMAPDKRRDYVKNVWKSGNAEYPYL